MARFIFIFPIILVYFLTIVSYSALGKSRSDLNSPAKIETFSGNDTIATIFSANFENNIFSGWKQMTDWEVSASEKISGISSLKHSSKAISGNSAIFHTAVSDLNSSDVEWSLKLKNGNWDPSSSNRFWFYLSADTIRTDLINGWAVGVNISGSSDLLELWRIRNGKADSLIIQTDLDWNASTLATITAKRTVRGAWTLQYQKPGETKSKLFSGDDPTVEAFKNIGIYFNYTPTRAGQLWADDISVVQLTSELFIQKLMLINSNTIRLAFNKNINPASIRTGNFELADENNQNIQIIQALATKGSDKSVDVNFGKAVGIELSLMVSGISDLSGKLMQPDTRSFSYSFSPEVGSILINEVLFNPFSGGTDFVELVNVSGQTIPVHRLKLATRDDALALKQIYPISAEKRYLKPAEFSGLYQRPGNSCHTIHHLQSGKFLRNEVVPNFFGRCGNRCFAERLPSKFWMNSATRPKCTRLFWRMKKAFHSNEFHWRSQLTTLSIGYRPRHRLGSPRPDCRTRKPEAKPKFRMK